MLDEGLEILDGLWSGAAFTFTGAYYHVEATPFLPVPVQAPRIPVWVAGNWPNRAPFRRAARWDGVFPLFPEAHGDELAQLEAVVRYVRQRRPAGTPLDVVHAAAPTPGDDPARAAAIVAPYAHAGVTWWLERINPLLFDGQWQAPWPVEAMRRRIQQGPPRLVR
jgi:alkanesulfonate monooxygenase SsuD/methylene tetrahydromethanopterin reductase-like flavin-dependent oxidoreductase (luciferase family)